MNNSYNIKIVWNVLWNVLKQMGPPADEKKKKTEQMCMTLQSAPTNPWL